MADDSRREPLLVRSAGSSPGSDCSAVLRLTPSPNTCLLYVAFLLLGICAVMPTFVIFAAVDYFNDISPGGDIEFSLNVVFNGTLFATSLASALFFQNYGFTSRIVVGFITIAACMAAMPLLDQLRGVSQWWSDMFSSLVLLIAAVLGVADAFAQASLFGLSSAAFPPYYTQALMFGVSICGTVLTLVRIACKAIFPSDLRLSSYIFFAIAAAFSLSAPFIYLALRRQPLFKSFVSSAVKTSPTLARREYRNSPPGSMRKPDPKLSFRGQAAALLRVGSVRESCALLLLLNAQQFLVVPSVVALSHDFIGDGWYQVVAILTYNLGDLCGRGPLAAFFPWPTRFIWPAVAVRVLLDVAVCLCVPPHALSGSPVVLLVVVAVFACSTGHLATCVISAAATHVKETDRETTGYLTILALFLGMICGSAGAYPLKTLITM